MAGVTWVGASTPKLANNNECLLLIYLFGLRCLQLTFPSILALRHRLIQPLRARHIINQLQNHLHLILCISCKYLSACTASHRVCETHEIAKRYRDRLGCLNWAHRASRLSNQETSVRSFASSFAHSIQYQQLSPTLNWIFITHTTKKANAPRSPTLNLLDPHSLQQIHYTSWIRALQYLTLSRRHRLQDGRELPFPASQYDNWPTARPFRWNWRCQPWSRK